jgi:uncharacterized membrane protein
MSLYDNIFNLFSGICHQIPERSFFIFGYQMPLCARCTGIFLGSILFLMLFKRSSKKNLVFFLLLILPMGLNIFFEKYLGWESYNIWRFITGLLYAYAIPVILLSSIILVSDRTRLMVSQLTAKRKAEKRNPLQ